MSKYTLSVSDSNRFFNEYMLDFFYIIGIFEMRKRLLYRASGATEAFERELNAFNRQKQQEEFGPAVLSL